MDPVELLLHPVRLRIVHALSGGRTLTTQQLCERIADASKATVYRHVAVLAEAGILETTQEQQVRGFVERHYRLQPARAAVSAERAAAATVDDHRRAFAASMAALLAEYQAYLDDPRADPARDQVGYRQHAVWLTEHEREQLIAGMRAAIVPHLANEPAEGRSQHLLSPILFPLRD
ncbi:helix-turn-helix domain-containing protein [Dactylosporangium matsuzakiense]|uniref:Transcriptional regulator n=1 Tax=Dactylosporangium matsuzakiense TaxID=53360 RepID=A0A9W6NRZ3_9ACTN|nr:helix-turn-helix domain-containing protein [Dactylosporangium matsuzakiense]UWZ41771.1 helix-turn-helix domain-containing protein [Dactylosporangium matsuzakiense]GLL06943.1 transcriptional regulator [Dactylosporangium matsuzakiense]